MRPKVSAFVPREGGLVNLGTPNAAARPLLSANPVLFPGPAIAARQEDPDHIAFPALQQPPDDLKARHPHLHLHLHPGHAPETPSWTTPRT